MVVRFKGWPCCFIHSKYLSSFCVISATATACAHNLEDAQAGEFLHVTFKDELGVQAGCIMWGARVIIPPQGRDEVMNIFHDSHPG